MSGSSHNPSSPAPLTGNALVDCVGAIVAALVNAYDTGDGDTMSRKGVSKLKSALANKFGLPTAPKTVDVIAAIPEAYKAGLVPILKTKPVRTASGIVAVAVMCKPHRCPHIVRTGMVCVYCPGGPDSDFEYSSQSYTGYEPTSMRAIRARYDPFLQAKNRLDQLKRLGHAVDKVEYIVMGGTFMALSQEYRDSFIISLHDALSGHISTTVEEAVRFSEQSVVKCVGLTIETRPDWCSNNLVRDMLRYGCTRLEIGVQSVYDDVLLAMNRGHTVATVVDCFHRLRDAGFKIVAHMMPNLPAMNEERDINTFAELFENPAYRPDGMKVYPCLVMRGTQLFEMAKTGQYIGYSTSTLVDVLAKALCLVPPWTRLYRIQRDIPIPLVSSGAESGNLRQLVFARMQENGAKCRDVRTREVGIQSIHHKINPNEVELIRRDYCASEGWETFLSYEDVQQDILIGMLRLRKPTPSAVCSEMQPPNSTSIIRELHVYGSVVPIHSRDPRQFQHQGYGTLLMEEAERIAREEHKSTKILVISGVGTRHYYMKFGFKHDGPYMSKPLV